MDLSGSERLTNDFAQIDHIPKTIDASEHHKGLLAESLLISVLAVALPLFVTTLTVARYRLSGEQTSLIFIDVFIKILRLHGQSVLRTR